MLLAETIPQPSPKEWPREHHQHADYRVNDPEASLWRHSNHIGKQKGTFNRFITDGKVPLGHTGHNDIGDSLRGRMLLDHLFPIPDSAFDLLC